MTERSRKKTFFLGLLIFVGGLAFAGLFNVGISATNEMAFCTSCHSMQIPFEEYKNSVHYKNTSGVQATCADCHVPKEFVPKMVAKVMAYKDVLHEILGTIDTPEKYEEHRWAMANRVWDKMEKSYSVTCLSCHEFKDMDLSEQDRSARKRHGKAVDKDQTCIECHKGVAHKEPDDPTLDL